MKYLFKGRLIFLFLIGLIIVSCQEQQSEKGKLFIIGGGDRPASLIDAMIETADLQTEDYVVVLPMASAIPDTTFHYIKKDINSKKDYNVIAFNFNREEAENQTAWIDSVKQAKLIYITGGDQNKFMDVVADSPLFDAIHHAYAEGATIAGTSAGAAVMSKIMITGETKISPNEDGFNVVWSDNVKTSTGLGFLNEDIIDQHFIRRNRYNRLLTLLSMYPSKQGIGIDESTAIICSNGKAKVVGDGQVVVLSSPKNLSDTSKKLVTFEDVKFSLLSAGDSFDLFTNEK